MTSSLSNNVSIMVNEFYQFIGKTAIQYKADSPILIPIKPEENVKENENENVNDNKTGDYTTTFRVQSFNDYLMYQLFYNYGIRRRMLNDYLALMYYDKHHKGYKADSNITRLFRHVIFDMRYLRIVSLGIPKGISIDEFCQMKEINKDNYITNFTDEKNGKFILQEFPEGSMIVYNPDLIKHKVDHVVAVDNVNPEEDETMNDKNLASVQHNIDSAVSQQFDKSAMFATRRVVGTSNYTTSKTFMEMFNENNVLNGVDIDLLPKDCMCNAAFVFNIEHPENPMINPVMKNRNMLCAIYEFKSEENCIEEYSKFTFAEKAEDIMSAITLLGNEMVRQSPLEMFKLLTSGFGVNFNIPEIINEIDGVAVNNIAISVLQEKVNNMDKHFQGYMVYGSGGVRSKITNIKYAELRKLKGNRPIGLEPTNLKNLFFLYWRLVKQNKIKEFLIEFDNNDNSTTGKSYKELFQWLALLINGLSFNLFKTYHNTFVKKLFEKSSIPYHLKPLCGDLNKQYWTDKVPVSRTMVENYITNLTASKVFWRLFYTPA